MFRIVPLQTAVADTLRALPGSERVIADEPHSFPCRHCLSDAIPGEGLVLASHSPFDQPGPYREVGPVFVHAEPCARYGDERVAPEQLRRRLLALRGYDFRQRIVAADVVQGSDFEPLLARLFERSDVDYVHVRFARTGCYACRIERA